MRLHDILKLILICVIAFVSAGCEEKIDTTQKYLNHDLTFILKEDVINLETASIRVKHNGAEDTQWVYTLTEDLTSDAEQILMAKLTDEHTYTGQIVSYKGINISLGLKELSAKHTYRLIVKGIDPETGQLYGNIAELIFKTRRDPDVWEENENWTLARKDERTQGVLEGTTEVIEYENFECTSSDEEQYIILVLSKDDFDSYQKEESHKDKMRTIFEDYHAYVSSTDEFKDMILQGSGIWKEQRLRSGDYVTYMIGIDEDGELSGLYKRADITIAQETPTEGYNKWLGWWEISFGNESTTWNVYIDNLDANMWYLSIGWEPEAIAEPVYNMGLKLYYDKSSEKIFFISQEVASSTDGSHVYYYGTFPYGAYQTVLDIENIRLAEANMTNLQGTEARISALDTTLPNVGQFTFTNSLFYISYPTGSIAASGVIPPYPWTMKKLDIAVQ